MSKEAHPTTPNRATHSSALSWSILTIALLSVLPLGAVVACRHSTPEHVIADAQATVQTVQEFDETFPAGVHFISYYTGQYGRPGWNSEVGLYGRYVLTMQAAIDLNAMRSRIVRFGVPAFTVLEVTTVELLPDGRADIRYGAQQRFGPREWSRLVTSHGDLRSIGLNPITDQPVPNFERALTNR